MEDKIHSYHNFMYPFSYNNDDFYEEIKKWPKQKINSEENLKFYNGYQYFNEKTRKLVYEINKRCENFQMYEDFSECTYRIEVEDTVYSLDIDNIDVKIYKDYKIGIISFNLINRKHSDIASIRNINNFGRRIFLPCLYDRKVDSKNERDIEYNSDYFSITACKLKINTKKNKTNMNFVNEANKFYKDIKPNEQINIKSIENHNINLIMKILYRKNDISEELKYNKFKIKAILDDRMFVASMIDYPYINNIFENSIKDISYARKLELYPTLFLDTDSTCQNESMIDDLFNKHLYLRWTGYGSLDCITEYGFVKLTNGMDVPSVGPPFLNMYMDMIKIALLQRCKLEAIESEVSNLNFDNSNKVDFDRIDELWEELITYKKDLGMKVLTFQEQGVECYDILRKSLRIDEIEAYVDDEMKKIHEYVELQKQNRMNKAIKLLTVITVLIGSEALIMQLMEYYSLGNWIYKIFITLNIILGIKFLFSLFDKVFEKIENFIYELKKKKNKSKSKKAKLKNENVEPMMGKNVRFEIKPFDILKNIYYLFKKFIDWLIDNILILAALIVIIAAFIIA